MSIVSVPSAHESSLTKSPRLSIVSSTIKVAMSQFVPKNGDISRNLETLREQAKRSERASADLLVTAELSLTGYVLEDRIYDLVLHPDSDEFEHISRIAAEHSVDIFVGFPYSEIEGVIYNCTALFDMDGGIQIVPKVMLPNYSVFNEKRYFRSGESIGLLQTSFGLIGAQVCYDLFSPEISRLLTMNGAQMLVVPSASPGMRQQYFEALISARAIENAVPIVYVNQAGIQDSLTFWGGSRTVSAFGDTLMQLPYDKPEWGIVDIDLEDSNRAKSFLPSSTETPRWLYEQFMVLQQGQALTEEAWKDWDEGEEE